MRLFVAVRPSEHACAALADALGRPADPRWHVTLVFLGEQSTAEPFDLAEVAARHAGFALRLEGGGTFHGRVLYAGLSGSTEALTALADDVRDACRRAGAEVERRPFHGHLTLKRGLRLTVPPALAEHRGPRWDVRDVELVRSTLGGPQPATHEVLARFPLGPAPG